MAGKQIGQVEQVDDSIERIKPTRAWIAARTKQQRIHRRSAFENFNASGIFGHSLPGWLGQYGAPTF